MACGAKGGKGSVNFDYAHARFCFIESSFSCIVPCMLHDLHWYVKQCQQLAPSRANAWYERGRKKFATLKNYN